MKANVVVDEAGRLVLPKTFREAIGVFGRTSVQVEVVNNAVQITAPEPASRPLSRRKGRLVYDGPIPENWDSAQTILAMRQQRLRR